MPILAWVAAGLVLISALVMDFQGWGRPSRMVLHTQFSQSENVFSVFVDSGEGFRVDQAVQVPARFSPLPQDIEVPLPRLDRVRRLRLDPGSLPGQVRLASLRFVSPLGSWTWGPAEMARELAPVQDIGPLRVSAEALEIGCTGPDPQFTLDQMQAVRAHFARRALLMQSLAAIIAPLIILAFGWLGRAEFRALRRARELARSRRFWASLISAAAAGILALMVLRAMTFGGPGNRLDLTLSTEPGGEDQVELFFDAGRGFNGTDIERARTQPQAGPQVLSFRLPAIADLSSFRIDPGIRPGRLTVHALTLRQGRDTWTLAPADILPLVAPGSQMTGPVLAPDGLCFEMTGPDPYFFLNLRLPLRSVPAILIYWVLVPLLTAGFVFLSRFLSPVWGRESTGRATLQAWTMTGVFLVIVGVPLIGMVVPGLQDLPSTEKRTLAERPTLSFLNLWQYPRAYEQYFNDRFLGRNALVRMDRLVKLMVFNDPMVPQITMGKDRWFFVNYRSTIPQGEERTRTLTPAELDRVRRFLLGTQAWFETRRLHLYVLWTPSKGTIYPELAPAGYRTEPFFRRWEQLKTVFRQLPPSGYFHFVDVTEAVRAGRSERALYYKGDQHWNNYGGYIGYRELVRVMSRDFPFLRTIGPEDIEARLERTNRLQEQDLLDLLNLRGWVMDDHWTVTVRDPEKYARKLDRVLFLHDSQLNAIEPLLPVHFDRPRVQHHNWQWVDRYYESIEREGDRVVVFEIGEPYSYYLAEHE